MSKYHLTRVVHTSFALRHLTPSSFCESHTYFFLNFHFLVFLSFTRFGDVRSHIGWEGERSIFYKGVKTSAYQTHFKNLERKSERESPKRTISASGGLGPLQMESKPDTERCASEKAQPRRGGGVDMRRCASKDAGHRRRVDWGVPHRLEKGTSASKDVGTRRGQIVRSHIGWGREQNILYKGAETSP